WDPRPRVSRITATRSGRTSHCRPGGSQQLRPTPPHAVPRAGPPRRWCLPCLPPSASTRLRSVPDRTPKGAAMTSLQPATTRPRLADTLPAPTVVLSGATLLALSLGPLLEAAGIRVLATVTDPAMTVEVA